MIREALPQLLEDACAFSERWMITVSLAEKLTRMQQEIPVPLIIISGYRTPEEQDALRAEGRPTAPNDRSTHLSCPATGADLAYATLEPTRAIKAAFGAAAIRAGLRWGGGSQVDDAGIPSDWNHVDEGPRIAP